MNINTFAKWSLGAAAATGGSIVYLDYIRRPYAQPVPQYSPLVKTCSPPPERDKLLSRLDKPFDLIVVGGGAVGTGVALDATTRGLNVCLLEKNDFASETSSKSTNLAHGGVRYLEKAIFQASGEQLSLVVQALRERDCMLKTAPHLCNVLPIMIPVYKWWQVPYYFVGCKLYDWLAGMKSLRASTIYLFESASAIAPMIDNTALKAACVYHDGIFNDARMNASLAITAIEKGATVLNYMEVELLIKEDGKIVGVTARNKESDEPYEIRATAVVNATGPFADNFLGLDKDVKPSTNMVVPSLGVHVVLPKHYCPSSVGVLDPTTQDSRLMFFLPWQGKVLAGTTERSMKSVDENPAPTEGEIQEILGELQKYLAFPVHRDDVLSAWSGIRPLVNQNSEGIATEQMARSHLITQSASGLVTVTGGRWTTYREMAEETVDRVVSAFDFKKPVGKCVTKSLVLVGGDNYGPTFLAQLMHEYDIPLTLANHLSHNYGLRAPLILEMYRECDFNKLPVALATHDNFEISDDENRSERSLYEPFDEPFTIAELKYALRYEYVRAPLDFLARRSRMAFLNAREAMNAVEGVVKVMKEELKWDEATTQQLIDEARGYIEKMGVTA